MRTTIMRSEQSWSLIDPRPVLLYLSHHDDYIVYWNGVAMTHSMALSMAMEIAMGVYPTPEMKNAMEQNYEKLYYANAFNTRAWDSIVKETPIYPYLKKVMTDHLKKVIEGKPPHELLGWFNYDKSRTLQTN
jgi:hypothetical protein